VARSRFGARLLRHYVAALTILSDGTRVAIARDGLYRAAPRETTMGRVFEVRRGSRPLNLAVDGEDRVLFGEYGAGLENSEVLLYASHDKGMTFERVFAFSRGDIRHVHSVIFEPKGGFWVMVGDFGRQTGVGLLSDDFKHFDWLSRGDQRVRGVRALVRPNCLVYGTDSDRERNFIVRLDKVSGKVETLREIEGSSLYAEAFGSCAAISTCVEPNPACPSREASLYLSADYEIWNRRLSFAKDRLHSVLFQFGTLVLPYSHWARPVGMLSGQALQRIDDVTCVVEFF
jgi:hypothetical protein